MPKFHLNLLVCICVLGLAGQLRAESAKQILETTGVTGGLVVHVGCGDGQWTTEFASASFLVHGLDTDPAKVAAARKRVAKIKLEGTISFDRLRNGRLPYTDGLVNLIVIQDPVATAITEQEIMRVLCPAGVAFIKKDGKWNKTVKPRPEEMDDWTHYLHDSTGNAVAQDTIVGPPRHMQWRAGPAWLRSHHTLASISSVVSAKGRLFYVFDESPASSISIPPRWFVEARDAFNGVPLWRRDIPTWADHRRKFRSGPVQMQRLLVTDGDRVFLPLGVDAPVSALDAATGKILATYKQTQHAEEILIRDGLLFVVAGLESAEQAKAAARRGGGDLPRFQKHVVVVNTATGKHQWTWPKEKGTAIMPLTIAATSQGVFFQDAYDAVALDSKTGKELWRTPLAKAAKPAAKPKAKAPAGKKKKKRTPRSNDPMKRGQGWSTATLVVRDGVILLATGNKLLALNATDGKRIWETPARVGFKSPPDVLVAGGLVWVGPNFVEGRDLKSGQVKKKTVTTESLWTTGHHHRCYRNKATERYIMSGKRGIEFFDLQGNNHSRNNWIRGVCQYGIMPANGLLYAPSHSCGCFMESKLYGFWALAPANKIAVKPTPTISQTPRLEKGPAYGKVDAIEVADDDWPTLRHDALRSGSTVQNLPENSATLWTRELGGQLSAPVVANGIVLVTQINAHRIVALDADSGKRLWTYTTGARVDSPPTIYQGTALVGSTDGWVYCLRLKDGVEVWRFRAAPDDLRAVAYGQLESLWPVHGSVLVQNGVAYVTAGRSSFLDGGLDLIALDPTTGKLLHQTHISEEHAFAADKKVSSRERISQNATDTKTYDAPDKSDAFSMKGATNDVMVGNGQSVFLRHLRFDAKGKLVGKRGRHLFSTSSLLDANESHRSHWVLGGGNFSRTPVAYSWIVNKADVKSGKTAFGYRLAVPWGVMLSFDSATAWPIKRQGGTYVLYATKNVPLSTEESDPPDFRKTAEVKTPGPRWTADLNLHPRAMLRAGDRILIGGVAANKEASATQKGVLFSVDTKTGKSANEQEIPSTPVWDGMAAVGGRLFIATESGKLLCLGDKR